MKATRNVGMNFISLLVFIAFFIKSYSHPTEIRELQEQSSRLLQEYATNITVGKNSYVENENIAINWSFATGLAQDGDWIGVYPESSGMANLPAGSELWIYCKGGTQSYSSGVPDSSGSTVFGPGGVDEGWPLAGGSYRAHIIRNTFAPYTVVASSAVFQVEGTTCPAAFSDISDNTHLAAKDTDTIDRIAFSSCFKPAEQINDKLWKYLRDPFCKDNSCAWAWLGDNMYFDTDNMEDKRQAYNNARNDIYYSSYGPVAEPKIPTTGTWDDHDYAWNNMGKHYTCKIDSQAEFVHHFNVPETDPRHPSQYPNQQEGVYSSNIFHRPDGTPNGIHLISLDTRYHRSLSFPKSYASCEGASSTILGDTQWQWLQDELNRPSDIKVIASGIQVLPPTNKESANNMCAYLEGGQSSFEEANEDIGEADANISGTSYESWGEFPQERTKLLRMVQKSVADGYTNQIIFISGDQHWAEISVKDIPAVGNIPEVRVHEVTASGIDQWWNFNVQNPNRLKLRETDSGTECVFPFTYNGVKYYDCTLANHDQEWCYTNSLQTAWANCKPYNDIYTNIIASKERVCSNSAVHVCNAQANFGGISVDWSEKSVTLSILTPHETSPIAVSVTFPLKSSPTPKTPSPTSTATEIPTNAPTPRTWKLCRTANAMKKAKNCRKIAGCVWNNSSCYHSDSQTGRETLSPVAPVSPPLSNPVQSPCESIGNKNLCKSNKSCSWKNNKCILK